MNQKKNTRIWSKKDQKLEQHFTEIRDMLNIEDVDGIEILFNLYKVKSQIHKYFEREENHVLGSKE